MGSVRVRLGLLAAPSAGFIFLGYLWGSLLGSPGLGGPDVPLGDLRMQDVADAFVDRADLESLERQTDEAASWASAKPLTLETLPQRQKAIQEMGRLRAEVVDQSALSLTHDKHEQALELLEFVRQAAALQQDRLEGMLPYAAGVGGGAAFDTSGVPSADVVVQVRERPFGMHVGRGTLKVDEVFPGFPAHRLGIQSGCILLDVDGQPASAGTWIQAFQQAPLPFSIRLRCSKHGGRAKDGQQPLSKDEHHYRAMVVKKPFGMNIQVNVVPRVVEVLPGYPAEAAGVKKGFVLTEVDGKAVDGKSWFKKFQNSKLPFTLTFDTAVPLHEGNPFIAPSGGNGSGPAAGGSDTAAAARLDDDAAYEDFRCEVTSVPFGMAVHAPIGGAPAVQTLAPGKPAEALGVRVGDVLVEVAGRGVDSSSWFATLSQAVPPFGLRFRRPRHQR